MKLEDQVCSLDLAKRLKELGVKQESLFYWNCLKEKIVYNKHLNVAPIDFGRGYVSAFTAGELGESLPQDVEFHKCKELNQSDIERGNYTYWYCGMSAPTLCKFPAVNEADARAKILIFLIENNLISN